jgi:hypothetical protein
MTREQRLILAVINLAIKDYKNGGKYAKSARAYFAGPVYKHHVESLGLLPGTMPLALSDSRKRG